jgi:hypothetical protein
MIRAVYSNRSRQYTHSESSLVGLLDEGGMAQLHPPHVVEGQAVGVKEKPVDKKR